MRVWEESKCSWKAYAISCNDSAVTSRSFRTPSDEWAMVCRVIHKTQWSMTCRGLDFKIPSFTPAADGQERLLVYAWESSCANEPRAAHSPHVPKGLRMCVAHIHICKLPADYSLFCHSRVLLQCSVARDLDSQRIDWILQNSWA